MATQVQFRGGTTSEHSSFNGAAREVTVDTTKQTLVVQDGSTNGGFPLLRENGTQSLTTTGQIFIDSDSSKFKLGADGELEIFHDGSNSYIKESAAVAGHLVVDGWTGVDLRQGETGDLMFRGAGGGGAKLYYDGGTPALETTSTGVKITSSGSSHGLYIYKGSNIVAYLGHIGSGDEGQLSLKNGGSDTIVLNGETGAGTFNGNVTITNTQPKLFLTDTNNTSDFSIQNENGNLNLYDETNTASRLRITAAGDATFSGNVTTGHEVTISGADPRLKFVDTDNSPDFTIWANAQKFVVYDEGASTSRVHINSSGSIGLGTDDPDRALHIESVNPYLRLTESNTDPGNGEITGMVEFETRDSNNPGVAANIRAELMDNTNGACTLFFSAGTPTTIGTKMEIQHSGDVKVNSGNLVIGTGGKGIDFSAQTWTSVGNTINSTDGNPEVLDHYEEGTWTPSDQSGAGMTFSVTGAVYTRIGRMVYARAHQINFPTTNNTTGAYIGGLPFTCGGSHGSGGRGVISNSYSYAQLVDNNSSKFWMYGATTTSGSTYANLSGAVIYGLCLIYEIST